MLQGALKMVEQIYHASCSDKKAPENYWKDIGFIASLIGSRLQSTPDSTIEVSTSKEKFGEVRVYCQLAEDKNVHKKYVSKRKNELFIADMYDSLFSRKCIVSDAILYRETYKNVVSLMPHYTKAITNSADYRYLLLDTFEDFKHLFESDRSIQALISDDFCISEKHDLLSVIQSIYAQ
jgi:hypothetical protein